VRPNAKENDQISPQSPFELPEVRAVVRATHPSCQNARKAQKFTPVWGSSGESRLIRFEIIPRFAQDVYNLRPRKSAALNQSLQ
jgi:hypothetical protein